MVFFPFSCTCDVLFCRISGAMSEHSLYDIRGEILDEKSYRLYTIYQAWLRKRNPTFTNPIKTESFWISITLGDWTILTVYLWERNGKFCNTRKDSSNKARRVTGQSSWIMNTPDQRRARSTQTFTELIQLCNWYASLNCRSLNVRHRISKEDGQDGRI